jgi:hypothetical protein
MYVKVTQQEGSKGGAAKTGLASLGAEAVNAVMNGVKDAMARGSILGMPVIG